MVHWLHLPRGTLVIESGVRTGQTDGRLSRPVLRPVKRLHNKLAYIRKGEEEEDFAQTARSVALELIPFSAL